MTLESCTIQSHKFPCVWLASHTAPTIIRDCTLQPAETAIGIWSDCGDVEISHCIVRGGISGINSVVQDWSAAHRLVIVNNTCDRTVNFLGFQSSIPPTVEVVIANNLILDGTGNVIPEEALADLVQRNTFRCNYWQVAEGALWTPETLGRFAVELQEVGRVSRVIRRSQTISHRAPIPYSPPAVPVENCQPTCVRTRVCRESTRACADRPPTASAIRTGQR